MSEEIRMRAFRSWFVVPGVLLPMAASAGEALVARWDAPRTVKLDLFYFEPGFSQWGSDFEQPLMEQWTSVLACTPSGPRREACTFVDGIWYGFVKDGTTVLESRHLPAPGTLEFEWTERGQLSAWDVQGDRQAFADVIGNAVLEARYVRREVSLSADERRERGLAAEGFLTRALGGTLEWEMPKKPDATTWKPAFAPRALLRYAQGTTGARSARPSARTVRISRSPARSATGIRRRCWAGPGSTLRSDA
jgi:hypothetical protein